MQVYPAAGLVDFIADDIPVYFIDPKPSVSENRRLTIYAEKASTGVPKVVKDLLEKE